MQNNIKKIVFFWLIFSLLQEVYRCDNGLTNVNLESYVMHLIHSSKPGRNPARESRCIFAFNAKNREYMRFFQILHVSRLCIHNFCCLLNSRFLRISSVFSHGNYASIQFSFNLSANLRNCCVMTPRKRR